MQKVLYWLLFIIGLIIWIIGMTAMAAMGVVSIIGNKVLPNPTLGNCWTFAVPLFLKHGGYLLIRKSKGQKFLKYFPVFHIIWVTKLGEDTELRHYAPISRKYSKWLYYITEKFYVLSLIMM